MAVVLAIGGLDSSCGAGVLRDAQTIQSLGHLARVAATAVTAQSDAGVLDVHPVSSATLKAQMVPASAVKIGMLCDAQRAQTVVHAMGCHSAPIVLDPVLAASSGGPLLDAQGIETLLTELLPMVTLVTPNLPELARLAMLCGERSPEPQIQARALMARGAGAVLIKGGHAQGPSATDYLVTSRGVKTLDGPRFGGARRGTGCTLSSAIACGLAEGRSLPEACVLAKQTVSELFARPTTA